jgi:hypothetical protein
MKVQRLWFILVSFPSVTAVILLLMTASSNFQVSPGLRAGAAGAALAAWCQVITTGNLRASAQEGEHHARD